MRQVLLWIPIHSEWFPDGIPIYSYGAMLFLAFVTCVWYAGRHARRNQLEIPRDRIQDMAIALFIAGLFGARLVYIVQFNVPIGKIFRIWEGGIVLYGGIIGGILAFFVFHRLVLRKFRVGLWQMADLAAPCLCIGIALGRVGCMLNGCCWGNPAAANIPSAEFPLLTGPCREMLVERDNLQTPTGFLIAPRSHDDPRTVIRAIEPGSAAARAGLIPGDRIIKLKYNDHWKINSAVLLGNVTQEIAEKIKAALKDSGTTLETDVLDSGSLILRIYVDDPAQLRGVNDKIGIFMLGRQIVRSDRLGELLNNWPRGRNSVQFIVERGGQELELPAFTPRSIGLHPTQIYEIISMSLLLVVLLTFHPIRQHDGQTWVLFMAGYAIHRFLNEIIRTEPVEGMQMTLSQLISIGMIIAALGIELYLRRYRSELRKPSPIQVSNDVATGS